VPLVTHGELLGTLAFGSRGRAHFRVPDLELIDIVAAAVAAQLARARLSRLAAADVAAPGPLRVLVVDDNRDAADSTVLLLEVKGFEAFACYDGEEAVARACALRPDVILLDLELPKKSGHEACRAIRAAGLHDTFIVAITGYDGADVRRRSAAAGCDAHHVKPVGAAVIEQLLAPLVARKGPRRDGPSIAAARRYTNDAS
jgi:CheY-like chemotaxis protein